MSAVRFADAPLIPGAVIFGVGTFGVPGASVPATGAFGPPYIYPLLSSGQGSVEVRGALGTIPAGLTLFANEDTSFTATGADGVYEVPFTPYFDGVPGPGSTFEVVLGSGVSPIAASVGAATAAGGIAAIQQAQIVQALIGGAVAGGVFAAVLGIKAGSETSVVKSKPPAGNAPIRRRFEEAIYAYGKANNIPCAFENTTFAATRGVYLRCNLIPNRTGSEDLAQRHRRYQGIYQISIVVPAGQGPGQAEQIALDLDMLFPISAPAVVAGLRIYITSPMSAGPAIEQPDGYFIPVSCQYRADTI